MIRPKLIALALAGILTLAAFPGCADGESPTPSSSPSPTNTPVATQGPVQTPPNTSGSLDPDSPQGLLRAYDYYDFGEAPSDRIFERIEFVYRKCPKVTLDATGQRILEASIVGAAWAELNEATAAFDALTQLPPLPWEEGDTVFDATIDAYYRDIPDAVALAWVEAYRPWYAAIENVSQAIDDFIETDECGA